MAAPGNDFVDKTYGEAIELIARMGVFPTARRWFAYRTLYLRSGKAACRSSFGQTGRVGPGPWPSRCALASQSSGIHLVLAWCLPDLGLVYGRPQHAIEAAGSRLSIGAIRKLRRDRSGRRQFPRLPQRTDGALPRIEKSAVRKPTARNFRISVSSSPATNRRWNCLVSSIGLHPRQNFKLRSCLRATRTLLF